MGDTSSVNRELDQLYFAKGLANIYRFTKSYDETMKSPFFPTMMLLFLGHLDGDDSPIAVENRVQQAGGWEVMDGNFMSSVLSMKDPYAS